MAKFIDPLGLLSPIPISFKIFMQELSAIKLGWDEQLAWSQLLTWQHLLQMIEDVENWQIPRWIKTTAHTSIELHGFCDASQLVMAATIYIKTTTLGNESNISLLCSKTKVAPLKRITIPRLKLTAAVILTKLVAHCRRILNLQEVPCYLWTNSAIVHTWLNSHPSRWRDFVHNRLCLVQETLPDAQWKHVSGTCNPADCATRGLSARELRNHRIWWEGPTWLSEDASTWPRLKHHSLDTEQNIEQRGKITTVSLVTTVSNKIRDLLLRYSCLDRLLRITARCQRITKFCRKTSSVALRDPITHTELIEAETYWTKTFQHEYFRNGLRLLRNQQELPKSNALIRLLPFIDSQGLLRVRGRLRNASLDRITKQPYILPKNSPLTTLIIQKPHKETLHGSTQDTLNYIRNKFWILGGRAPVRSSILKCIVCTRYRRSQAKQIMGQLPASRVTPSRAFLHSGIDYAGAFILKTWKGRAARTYKSWIAVFICYLTTAIHLEIVTDYTTDAFLAAYKRFTSRRGICASLNSDCGTNFKGADKELKNLFSQDSEELKHLASLIATDGTKWEFNPPAAAHFGGKFEAAVKSMKYHIKRVIGEKTLTYEHLSTVLAQIEAILNSRPLCPLTEDLDDLSVLTPGHFLIGQPLTLVPEPNLEKININRLSQWQQLFHMTQSYWSKWSKKYLQRFQAVYKWNRMESSIKEGTMLFVINERYPPGKWPLGRVIAVHPGPDNIVRVVTVKTASSTIVRPIVKLCPLDISSTSGADSPPGETKAGGKC